jgi:hypothetical protein
MAAPGGSPSPPHFTPGQTIIFLGDHTSPDEPGYVSLVREVLQRFYPQLGQSAAGLGSRELMDLLSSARPDWLVIGIGLADALREPSAQQLLKNAARAERDAAQAALDDTFGPELRPERPRRENAAATSLVKLDDFAVNLASAVQQLQQASMRVALLTTIVLGNRIEHPANQIMSAYNRAIREQAEAAGALLVDVERAFRDVIDRAGNYKQKVTLTSPGGELNAQGQALIVRTLLVAFGLLPSGRSR